MADRIGVFVCSCGPNIGEKISVTDLAAFARELPEVAEVRTHALLCSGEGQTFLAREIRESALDKVVVAGCSPREHELTFRNVLEKTGLNPYQLQMANLREQCAWVTADPAEAAEKARSLIRAAVDRVRLHQSIPSLAIDMNPDVLVVGAGVAGITAALNLAQKGRRIYLVEQSPFVGGKAVLYEKIFPQMECGSCMLSPLIDTVLHHDRIEVHLLSQGQQIRGFWGNFEAVIQHRARGIKLKNCLGCGTCLEACPVEIKPTPLAARPGRKAISLPLPGALPNIAVIDRAHCRHFQGDPCRACREVCPFGAIDLEEEDGTLEIKVGAIVLATGFDLTAGRSLRANRGPESGRILSALEMEELLNSNGPTAGKILTPPDRIPKRIGILPGSGVKTPGGSGLVPQVLLEVSLKVARMIRDQIPESRVSVYLADRSGWGPEAYRSYQELSGEPEMTFIRLQDPAGIQWVEEENRVRLEYRDEQGEVRADYFDLLIVGGSPEGSNGSRELAGRLKIPFGEDGFLITEEMRWGPVDTVVEGIFAIGCARGLKTIPESILDGQAAAGRILSRLIPGEKLILKTATAVVREETCSGCNLCLDLCPYQAIEMGPGEGAARIREALCRGCGLCAAACPSGAIEARHFQEDQVAAEVKGLLC
jgi:heterodisulfide reductase subunit A